VRWLEYGIGSFGPDERLRVIVLGSGEGGDVGLKLIDAAMDAALDLVFGEIFTTRLQASSGRWLSFSEGHDCKGALAEGARGQYTMENGDRPVLRQGLILRY
jgi:hypothetical protein